MALVMKSKGPRSAENPSLLSEDEAARQLGLAPEKLRRLRYQRRGPKTIKLGRVRLIRREDLEAWITENAR
jgi:excisionase family DNA binding protein